jgi:hypothetical protein
VRWFWWLICLSPPVALLMSLDTARTHPSADAALGLVFFMWPFELAALLLSPVLLYRAVRSREISRADRSVIVTLGLSAVPLFVLNAAITQFFGGWPREVAPIGRALTLACTTGWVALAIAARRTLHRGIPAGWPQLVRWLWRLLILLPPVSMLLAIGNTVPDNTTDPGPYPLWPFLAAAVALTPLLARRALVSPRVTDVERILIIASSLSVLPLFLLGVGAQFVRGGPVTGAAPWAFLLALTLGWVALAVATRRKRRA